MLLKPDYLDEHTCAIYLLVPAPQVVVLQAHFEAYDGVAVVRTLDLQKSLIAILTTPAMLPECLCVLAGIRTEVAWDPAPETAASEQALSGLLK